MLKIKSDADVIGILTSVIQYAKPIWSKNLISTGITKGEFLSKVIPDNYVVKRDTSNFIQLRGKNSIDNSFIYDNLEKCRQLLGAQIVTNAIMYKPMTEMPWHTDYELPGTRIYYTFTVGESIFRYRNCEGSIVEDYDNLGWTTRKFKPGKEDNLLWHSVWTEKARFSFGFKFNDD